MQKAEDAGNRCADVTAAGCEKVNVPAGKFGRALKINIVDTWPKDDSFPGGSQYKSTAWFVKGLGLVKWIRTTGRIDELVSYEVLNTPD